MTNLITITGETVITMTSLELVAFINEFRQEQADNDGAVFPSKGYAELTHADFLKKVPEVLGSEVAGNFSGKYTASNGKANPKYVFPKREACLMAMSYSYELQARVYDRMTELEAKVSQPDPMAVLSDPSAMRGLLLTYTEKVIALQGVVAEQTPKAAFHDQVVQSERVLSLGETAKVLGTGRTRLARWLREHRWINRSLEPYQDKIEAGLLDLKYSKRWQHPENGETRSITTMVTGKGLSRLQRVFAPEEAAPRAGLS